MAVPFRRTSKTRKRKRRTHYKLTAPSLTNCPNCGEPRKPHHVCGSCGHYKGVDVLNKNEAAEA